MVEHWNFELEKLLSIESSVALFGILKDKNVRSSAYDEVWLVKCLTEA